MDPNPSVAVDESFDDETIQTTIDFRAAEASVEEIRDVLNMIQESFEEVWKSHMDALAKNAMELVEIDRDVLVFADHTGQFWNEEFNHGPLGELDPMREIQSVIESLHHKWARRHSDYGWDLDSPVVIKKPESFEVGQLLVESVMHNLTNRPRGLTPREAWCVWGVMAGNSRNQWASRMGYDSHSGVSNAVREAERKLGITYL